MQNNENKIDKLFSDGLANFEQTPPPIVWDKISETMGHRKSKARALWWWSASVAASILLAFIAGWYLSHNRINDDELYAQIELLKKAQVEKIALSSPVENKVILQFNRPEPVQPIAALTNKTNITVLEESSVSISRNNEIIDLMTAIDFEIKANSKFNYALVDVEDNLSEFDQKMIEANLLAMNDQKNLPEEKGRLVMGLQASPVYRFEQTVAGAMDVAYASGIENSVTTNYKPNLAGGVSISYDTGKKLAIVTGVNYSEVAQNSGDVGLASSGFSWFNNKDYLDAPTLEASDKVASYSPQNVILNTNVGTANIILPEGTQVSYDARLADSYTESNPTYNYEQEAGYIEVPFLLKYKLIDKRIGLHLLGGINTNILVTNTVSLINRGEVVANGNIENLSPITYSSSLGMGMNYKLNERFKINFDPTLKIQINSLNTQSNFKARPYAFGVFSGITYQF